ncbi:unnamed protein product [Meganyctiphanes norvegica]|uniref:MYND-type domain-containing protein n=1 Tax=Meganyctiphanes norvegica TaxID=48144 RepID=A0AAV2QY93_MEGNR
MGSSCLIKTCTVKKAKVGASFHRLPWKYPSLFATLNKVFGDGNVRELTRWSRICSLHIAQLAPLSEQDEVIKRLMEYYAWNARSYKRLFEIAKKGDSGDANLDKKLETDVVTTIPVERQGITLEELFKSGVLAMRPDGHPPQEAMRDGDESLSNSGDGSPSNSDAENEDPQDNMVNPMMNGHNHVMPPVTAPLPTTVPAHLGLPEVHNVGVGVGVGGGLSEISSSTSQESGHAISQYLMQLFARRLSDSAHESNSPRSMIPDDSVAGAMDASRDPDTNLEEASKKTVQGEEQQDINDNHTKTTAETAAAQNNEEASTDSSSSSNKQIINGLVEPSQSSESQVNNDKSDGAKESDSSSNDSESVGGGEGEGQKEVMQESEHNLLETEDTAATLAAAATAISVAAAAPTTAPGTTEEEDGMKDESEDDEDKLVINEGGAEKRLEDSNDEDSIESSVPAGGSPAPGSPFKGSAPCTPKRSEKRPAEDDDSVEVASKRQRPLEDLMTSLDGLETVTQVEGSLGQVKRDLQALEFLIKQKEEEWNTLLRLQKRKEEMYLRLVRRRQVLLMRSGAENPGEHDDSKIDVETVDDNNSSNLMFLPQGGYSSLGGPQVSMMMINQLMSGSTSPTALQMTPQIVTRPESAKDNGNISVIDIMTSSNKPGSEAPRVSMSAEAHSKLSKQLSAAGMAAMKPILPKPAGSGAGSPTRNMIGAGSFNTSGVGPQGPTINVQALIAAHRKENPHAPPVSGVRSERRPHTGRGAKRGDWRRRYDGDRRSGTPQMPERPPSVSSSSSEADTRGGNNKSHLHMSDPNVSYKDVLLQFAQLTQAEKQPGSPQISIFPVGASESRKSEGSRESTPGVPTSLALAPRDLTPPNLTASKALQQQEGVPSALARLLMERGGAPGMAGVKVSEAAAAAAAAAAGNNSEYLTLSALLSGGSTTTNIKDKVASNAHMHQQIAAAQKQLTQTQGDIRVGNKKPSQGAGGQEESGNPKCQGCHKHRAQFVCAGCGNQWYCSRECQVSAWEEHSEHCTN